VLPYFVWNEIPSPDFVTQSPHGGMDLVCILCIRLVGSVVFIRIGKTSSFASPSFVISEDQE